MDKKFTNVLISLVVILALFAVVMFVLGAREPAEGEDHGGQQIWPSDPGNPGREDH